MTPALKPVEVAARLVDDGYLIRDDLAQSYNPTNALERMLVTQMAQSWLRLQRAHAAEERYFKTHDLLDAITNDFERYKAITRLVADCERAWRHAMLAIEKAQRRRKQQERIAPPARRRPLPETIILGSGAGTPACSRLASPPPQPEESTPSTA